MKIGGNDRYFCDQAQRFFPGGIEIVVVCGGVKTTQRRNGGANGVHGPRVLIQALDQLHDRRGQLAVTGELGLQFVQFDLVWQT